MSDACPHCGFNKEVKTFQMRLGMISMQTGFGHVEEEAGTLENEIKGHVKDLLRDGYASSETNVVVALANVLSDAIKTHPQADELAKSIFHFETERGLVTQ